VTDETEKKEEKRPAAWGDKKTGPKHWTEGGHGDDEKLRVTHAPLAEGIGTGKSFFFLFGYKRASSRDQDMLKQELAQIDDDIEVLRKAGYTVVVDPQGTRDELIAAVEGRGVGAEGLTPAGLFWSAHGHADGALECCDGGVVRSEDLDPTKVSPGLRLAVFSACYVGSRSRTWRKALGGRALVVGWGRPVTIERAVDFLVPDPESTTDLDDLIARWLLTDAPLPDDTATVALPPAAASLGRAGELGSRIKTIAEMLGAEWHDEEGRLHVHVPLHEGRTQVVDVFVADATEPFSEGELVFGAEADVGELSALITPEMLLANVGRIGWARIALVASDTDMPRVVTQTFAPWTGATDQQLAARIYAVAERADDLERKIFGVDRS
jgi:hypothetical protein